MNASDMALAESLGSTKTLLGAWGRKWGVLVKTALLMHVPLQAAPMPVFLEAELGDVTTPMAVRSDSSASESGYVAFPVNNSGSVTYSIDIPVTAQYVIWCRVLATSFSSDSFFVSANDGPEDIYDVAEGTSSPLWQWSQVNGRGGTTTPLTINPRIFNLAEGHNRLTFRAREANAGLDRLIVTTDLSFSPYSGVPFINVQPRDQGLPLGSRAVITVVATGSAPLTYQWRFNNNVLTDGGNIQGAMTSTLTIDNIQPSDTGIYRVLVRNSSGTVASREVVLALSGFIQAEINQTPAGGTVNLPAGVFWENAQICKNLTLQGAGAQNTIIDGNADGSVFRICSGSTVTLDGLTIRNGLGSEGSGIWNAGTLTLRSAVVTSNYLADGNRGAAGLFNSGTAYLEDCIVRNNETDLSALFSGGIYNTGTMRVERTMISNYSEAPGGINNAGSMFLKDTTITSNAGHGIGGIGNSGQMGLQNCTVVANSSEGSGGIANWGMMALTNCTVSGNDGAETGGISSSGAGAKLTLEFCTVYSNRCWGIGFAAGITHIEGVAELRNTIIASNLPGSASGPNLSGSFISLGHNLIGLNNPPGAPNTFTLTGDTASNILGQDPLLGPLQDNGGPAWTHALRPGSPAIDAGANTSVPATDQRGYQRARDGNGDGLVSTDIGSFELQWPVVRVTSLVDNGPGTLRRAITTASAGSIIELAVAGTIQLTSGELWITRDLSLNGLGANISFITGAGLVISNDVSAWISNLAITGVRVLASGSGNAIKNQGNLSMDHCVISENGSELGNGGGIHNQRNLTMTDCSIIGNYAGEGDGGGIYNAGSPIPASLTMNRCTVAQNRCNFGDGGGIKNNGTLVLNNCTISQNRAGEGDGGGIASFGFAMLDSSTICSNQATSTDADFGRGGGLAIRFGGKLISRSTICARNTARNAAPDCFGILDSAGFNLLENQNGCTLAGDTVGNILGQNPLLGPLRNNGGSTLTHALLSGSPAIDAGPRIRFLATDQRGVKRPQDGDGNWIALPDIGAFEQRDAWGHYIAGVRLTPGGQMQLQLRGVADRWYTILAATNVPPQTWTSLNSDHSGPNGFYEFTDPNWGEYPIRFYRVLEQ